MTQGRQIDRNIDEFNLDIAENDGYRYTTNAQLSSILANQRLSESTLEVADFTNKRVVDIGCGDGTYTVELFDLSRAQSIHGIDPAGKAIEVAKQKVGDRNISFSVENAYALSFEDDSYDIAYLRGVLHHMEHPIDALREALRVAREVVVVEPNGYSPVLKIIEQVSVYHRVHEERSYSSATLDRWIQLLGGRVTARLWAGLVPMFCPDWFARLMKVIEPVIEAIPLVNRLACAVYVFRAERRI